GTGDDAADRGERNQLDLEVDAHDLLPGADRDLAGFRCRHDARVVGRRVAGRLGLLGRAVREESAAAASTSARSAHRADARCELLQAAAEHLPESGHAHADVVLAGRQPKHAIDAAIVRLIAARRGELAIAANVLIALYGHERARERFAVIVEHAAG